MTPVAVCLIRDLPHYRREAFVKGLVAAGKRVVGVMSTPKSSDDWLVIWNRYGSYGEQADAWERCGGTVLVCENGYIGTDSESRQLYAIAIKGHNGSGRWFVGDEDRFSSLGIKLAPWRDGGRYVLVCGQRGIGTRLMASPINWHEGAAKKLRHNFEVKLRLHPGRHEAQVPLLDDLNEALACAVWSSSSGIKALVHGVPVLYDAPFWVGSEAANRLDTFELKRDDESRRLAMHRMSWAQWTVDEIASGIPFEHLKKVQ
jgi:hypothetical protein